MRRIVPQVLAAFAVASLAACTDDLIGVYIPEAPTNLTYQLEPSGNPAEPRGIILRWTAVDDPDVIEFRVYSRGSVNESFGLRGATSSTSFHDDGPPHLEYFVTAVGVGGGESERSNVVLVDERLRLPAPATLVSVSLNRAIHLDWADNAYEADPDGFAYYRVYSTSYNLDQNLCASSWVLEGTTVAPSFYVGALVNGQPRCFAVSAITIEGFESLWSPLRYDTPRPDARNVVVFTTTADPTKSGFRFWLDANGNGQVNSLELGIVASGTGTNMDFAVVKNGSGIISLVPQRSAVTARFYEPTAPIPDLTSIDIAPASGYGTAALEARVGYGYVFQMNEGDGFYRYGALRVTAVGTDYVIFDWSYQTDPGNPELVRRR
ncbi:MAG TPA: hypothetical protein VNL98_12895 [Gemmatimonadales bacterium]|nr:hypothetical protein [Gemmatimonadales bacterium]